MLQPSELGEQFALLGFKRLKPPLEGIGLRIVVGCHAGYAYSRCPLPGRRLNRSVEALRSSAPAHCLRAVGPRGPLDGATAMPYSDAVFEFIETPHFTRILDQYLEDDEYSELQRYLNANPETGVVVPGSGGVRKLRWRAEGRGKRGGLRLIYFVKLAREEC